MEIKKEIADILLKQATTEIKKHTIQLFTDNSKNSIESFGSGVLVEVEGIYILVTANHVIEDYFNNPLKILIEGKEHTILSHAKKDNFKFLKDPLDMAYIKLEKDVVAALKNEYMFLPTNKIRKLREYKLDKGLVAAGYPKSRQKIWRHSNDSEIKSTIVYYDLVMADDKLYDSYKVDKNQNILLNYPKMFRYIETDDLRQISHPKGLSGGGLWDVTYHLEDGEFKTNYSLVGIMSGFKVTQKKHVLSAGKIEFLIDFIKKEEGFPIKNI